MRTDTKNSAFYESLVEAIIRQRKSMGLRQADLAKAIGIDQTQVSKLERFERRMDVPDFLRICQVLKIDPCKLLKRPESIAPKPRRPLP